MINDTAQTWTLKMRSVPYKPPGLCGPPVRIPRGLLRVTAAAAQGSSAKNWMFTFSWTKTNKQRLVVFFIFTQSVANFRALIIPIEKVSEYLFNDDYMKPSSWCINQSEKQTIP